MFTERKRFLTLVFLFVLFPAILKILIFNFGRWAYIADEVVVTNIATLPFREMLQVIKSEPHPPGFYILLSLLPDPYKSGTLLKSSLVILNAILWCGTFYWIYKHKLLNRTNFIFFASILSFVTVYKVNSFAKQDIISLPLFMLFLANAYLSIKSKKALARFKFLLFNSIVVVLLGFVGYLSFGIASVIHVLAIIFAKVSYKKSFFLCVISFLPFAVYTHYFFLEQLAVNLNRFSWFNEHRNNYFASVRHLLLPFDLLIVSVSYMAIYFLNVFVGFREFFQDKRKLFLVFVFGFLTTVLIMTSLKIFVRPRYAIFLHLLVTYFFAVGLVKVIDVLRLKEIYAIFFVLLVFLMPTTLSAVATNIYIDNYGASMSEVVSSVDKIGILASGPVTSYILHIGYRLDNNAIPLSKEISSEYQGKITFEMLSTTKENLLSVEEIKDWLAETKLSKFLYFHESPPLKRTYDSDSLIQSTLQQSCANQLEVVGGKYTALYLFENCEF